MHSIFPKQQANLKQLTQLRTAIPATMRCEAVIEMIRKDASLSFMAVVDEEGVPVGTLERQAILAAVSHPSRYAVFQNKPITHLHDAHFTQIDSVVSLDRLCNQIAESEEGLRQAGLVIVEDGKYVGVLDGSVLLNHIMLLNAARSKELAEAHETVMDSVNYASRIQQALLPDTERFEALLKGVGLLWEPRDVVGGDIYWLSPVSRSGCFWVAMIDCTGHGVPGAMVSMLVAASLERIYDQAPDLNPGTALARLGDMIRRALHQDYTDAGSNDGFDAAILKVSPQTGKIIYAGARIGIFVVPQGNGPIERINGSKMALGYKGITPHPPLPETELQVADIKTLIVATDGVFDQPGGPFCRSFGPARWIASIEEFRQRSPEEMIEGLKATIEGWQGLESQRDDYSALVLGF